MPPQAPPVCYVEYAPLSDICTPAQLLALAGGTAVVRERVVVSPAPTDTATA